MVTTLRFRTMTALPLPAVSAKADRARHEAPTEDRRCGDRDGRSCSRGGAALFQPRNFLARVQPSRTRGSLQRRLTVARAAALPVNLGQQPRRILHGPRCWPQGPPDAWYREAVE